jgi:hypothetical protein
VDVALKSIRPERFRWEECAALLQDETRSAIGGHGKPKLWLCARSEADHSIWKFRRLSALNPSIVRWIQQSEARTVKEHWQIAMREMPRWTPSAKIRLSRHQGGSRASRRVPFLYVSLVELRLRAGRRHAPAHSPTLDRPQDRKLGRLKVATCALADRPVCEGLHLSRPKSLETNMSRHAIALVLLSLGVGASPSPADGRPVQGDKTISLTVTGFSYSHTTPRQCNADGDGCVDIGKHTSWSLGVKPSLGYLFSNAVELGMGLGVQWMKLTSEYAGSTRPTTQTIVNDLVGASLYGRLHLGSSTRTVPFLEAGGGWDLQRENLSQQETSMPRQEIERTYNSFRGYAAGGIDFYLAQKYAITGMLSVNRSTAAVDSQPNSDLNPIEKDSAWGIALGFGIRAYF